MTDDPLVAHYMRETRRTKQAWLFAGICQLWIWLNAVAALAFRFWVVDRFNFSIFVEQALWPGFFLLESLAQLCVVIGVGLGLFQMRPGRDFWIFSLAAAFSLFVNFVITMAWALDVFTAEYRLAATFGLFGSYLAIPAILFASYCALVPPRTVSLGIYAITVTIALKCAAIILLTTPSQAFVSYTVIILIALLSVVLPLRFGLSGTVVTQGERFAS